MKLQEPIVKTNKGAVRGTWKNSSARFLGIPFAQPPVGDLRFASPKPATAWTGVRDASKYGPTPQRRPLSEVTTIPEPSIPGDDTLNVNVFTPDPFSGADLPVLVWIHGGGFLAGSPASPWYDGESFNQSGIVTVSLSYRLGFDGFGWISDAPDNRGLQDLILGLKWVQEEIKAFGGDPQKVTIAGQSAGAAAVMTLLSTPGTQGLFSQAIAQSPPRILTSESEAKTLGTAFAAKMGVPPTRAGWATLSEDDILDGQAQLVDLSPSAEVPPAHEFLKANLQGGGVQIPFAPILGESMSPVTAEGVLAAPESKVPLLIGTVAHEFNMMTMGFAQEWSDLDAADTLIEAGLTEKEAKEYLDANPILCTTSEIAGQIISDISFRIPAVEWADLHGSDTWVYDFRWLSPFSGQAHHCLELPFSWGNLNAEGTSEVVGQAPPLTLAARVHHAWVNFISNGTPGWKQWDGTNPEVFGAESTNSYLGARILAAALKTQ